MLIWLDDSIAESLEYLSDDSAAGVTAIIGAVFRGEHLVLGNRRVFDRIASQQLLSALDRRIASAQASRLTQLGPLAAVFQQRITVVEDEGLAIEKTANGWKVQLSEIGRNGLRPMVLLAEDVDDVKMFLEAAHHYLIQRKLHSLIKPVADVFGAGGKSNVWRSFAVAVTNARAWHLCITDSDRMTHVCGDTQLTRRINKLTVDHGHRTVCSHFVLPTRELENLLPVNTVSDALDQLKEPIPKGVWNEYVTTYNVPAHIHAHADLKLGTSLASIQKLGDKGASRAVWCDEIIRQAPITGASEECKHRQCRKQLNAQSRCLCNVTPPILENLAAIVLQHLERNSRQEIVKRAATSFNWASWNDTGRVVAEWTCASSVRLI